MFVRCIRDFCECSIAGRREESLAEDIPLSTLRPVERRAQGPTVVADLQMQLCSRAREGAAPQMAHFPLLSERYDCARVGGPVERETWSMKSTSLGWWDWRSAASSWPVFF